MTSAIAAERRAKAQIEFGNTEYGISNILALISILRRICDHGKDLLPHPALTAWENRDTASVDWQTMRNVHSRCSLCEVIIDEKVIIEDSPIRRRCEHLFCLNCDSRSKSQGVDEEDCAKCDRSHSDGYRSRTGYAVAKDTKSSAKIEALLRNLQAQQESSDICFRAKKCKR